MSFKSRQQKIAESSFFNYPFHQFDNIYYCMTNSKANTKKNKNKDGNKSHPFKHCCVADT
jgi:hypothetical protein